MVGGVQESAAPKIGVSMGNLLTEGVGGLLLLPWTVGLSWRGEQ